MFFCTGRLAGTRTGNSIEQLLVNRQERQLLVVLADLEVVRMLRGLLQFLLG